MSNIQEDTRKAYIKPQNPKRNKQTDICKTMSFNYWTLWRPTKSCEYCKLKTRPENWMTQDSLTLTL